MDVEIKNQLICVGNIETWKKRRQAFFASKPRCSECNELIQHYTTKGMCSKCRAKFNTKSFEKNNPNYHKKYNKVRDKKRWQEKREPPNVSKKYVTRKEKK